MALTFRCPYCGGELSTSDEAAGLTGKCHFCNATIIAPSASGGEALLVEPGAETSPPADAAAPLPEPPSYHTDHPSAPKGQIAPFVIFGEAWDLTKRHWGVLAAGAIVANGLFFLIILALHFLIFGDLTDPSPSAIATFWVVMIVLAIAGTPLFLGGYSMAIEIVVSGQTSLATLFAPYSRFWSVVVAVISVIAVTTTSMLGGFSLILPLGRVHSFWALLLFMPILISLYVLLGVGWSVIEVLDRRVGPFEAIGACWNAARGKRLALFGAIFLFFAINSLASSFVFPVLFTAPLQYIGVVITYRQLRGLRGDVR